MESIPAKEMQRDLLMLVGYGDGGGGPTREMLENIHEMADFPAVPRMRQEHVGEFFRKLRSAHLRHDHIGQHQVDRLRVLRNQLQGFAAMARTWSGGS